MKTHIKQLSILMAIFAAASSQAAIIVYEGFNGSATGWDTPVTGSTQPSGLGYSSGGFDLLTSGGALVGLSSVGTLSAPVNSGTVWTSVLYQVTNASEANWTRLNTFSSGNEQLFLPYNRGDSNGITLFGRNTTEGEINASTGVTLTVGSTYFVVSQVDFGTGQVNMWVNPQLGVSDPGEADATATFPVGGDVALGTDQMSFNQIQFRDTGTAGLIWDELRIGTSYGDVAPTAIPEPSTIAALFGSLILGFAFWRQRRS